MKYFSIFVLIFTLLSFQKDSKIELISKTKLAVKEPSDLCLSPNQQLFMISDNGNLYQTNLQGDIVKTSKYVGFDFEAICCDKNYIYVSEESNRKISVFDFDLNYLKSYILNYQGGRNKGFEAICFNEKTNNFSLISEKDPIIRRTYKKDFSAFEEVEMEGFSDVSSLTYYNDFYWVLSDEDHQVYQYNSDFELKAMFDLPVINPEGIAFLDTETVLILSDDMQVMYKFKIPQ